MSEAPRKIAVIVALDVAGYSARTEADEARATAEVAGLRDVIERIAKRHAGRVFNTAGDGFMLEFGSSLAAVEAALALAEACEPKVRVGVHLGDVVVQPNGDLLGHGVNVAARLMAQAAPGSALVSADVRRTIRGPLGERLVSRGSLKLDKMAETIEAFAIEAVVSGVAAVQPQPAEPLLAVLPFDNLSNDPEMQFFSDGVSEEILQTVARARGLKVIGRSSSFQFRGADKAVRKVANELRATHVLDGSVRRSGNHIRVTAHLVEAGSQTTLWTDRYDRNLTDVFELQDEIAVAIAQNLKTRFTPSAVARSIDPAVYELYLRARAELTKDYSLSDAPHSVALLEQVVASAPDFAQAWALLSHARVLTLRNDRDTIGEPAHIAAGVAAHRALELDPDCGEAYSTLAELKPAFADYDEKLRLTEKAIALAPSNSSVFSNHAHALAMVGRTRAASAAYERSVQLDPLLSWTHGLYGLALYSAGHAEDGVRAIESALDRFHDAPWVWLIHLLMLIDRQRLDDARVMLDAEHTRPRGVPHASVAGLRFCLDLIQMSPAERESTIRTVLGTSGSPAIEIFLCYFAANLGFQDIAFEQLFAALDSGRPIVTTGNRWFHAREFFQYPNSALRQDIRFPRLCARLSLVDYWRTSGYWPDCANEVPYDFKTECEKAAALAKA